MRCETEARRSRFRAGEQLGLGLRASTQRVGCLSALSKFGVGFRPGRKLKELQELENGPNPRCRLTAGAAGQDAPCFGEYKGSLFQHILVAGPCMFPLLRSPQQEVPADSGLTDVNLRVQVVLIYGFG